MLLGVRCSQPAGSRWELGNSDPFCAFKEGAESDEGEEGGARGSTGGCSIKALRLKGSVRDSSWRSISGGILWRWRNTQPRYA